jgi:two-component system sensor histidine kinase QseC
MRIKSIRQVILLGVISVVVVLLLTTGFITYSTAHHEMDEIFDAQLAQYARMIDQFISQSPLPPSDRLPLIVGVPDIAEDNIERTSAQERRSEGHKYEEKLVFQVWSSKGDLILRSKNSESAALIAFKTGYHDIVYNGRRWILYCVNNKTTGNWIITGQRDDVRNELSLYLAYDQLAPLAISLLPVILLIWLAVSWGLKPMRELSQAIATTKPSELTPLNLQLPIELRPFQTAINQLLDDLGRYLEKEKRFIASASHELRTPLSILLVHADNIKAAENKSDTTAAADAILTSTKRLSHLVSQLMEMEKLDGKSNLQTAPSNLEVLFNDALVLLEARALNNVIWSVNVSSTIAIPANFNLLLAAFRNLLDNAAKYAVPQTCVSISAQVVDGRVLIAIENQIQPGVSLSPERLGERFYRHERNQQIQGAGLGLSIVKKIISMHHGDISYDTTKTNTLIVRIAIPLSA